MHLFFFIRGVYQFAELYKAHIQNIYWKWDRINLKTKKKETILVQGALRQSFLGSYEYVFPEECLSEVLAIFHVSEGQDFKMFALRKMFGLKKIPHKNFEEAKKIKTNVLIENSMRGLADINIPGTGVAIIGMKKDIRRDFPEYGYNQEGL